MMDNGRKTLKFVRAFRLERFHQFCGRQETLYKVQVATPEKGIDLVSTQKWKNIYLIGLLCAKLSVSGLTLEEKSLSSVKTLKIDKFHASDAWL